MNGLVARSSAIVVGTVASPPRAGGIDLFHPLDESPHCRVRRPARSGRWTGYIRARNRRWFRAAAPRAAACWRTSASALPSNSRPHPIANSVSPVKTTSSSGKWKADVPGGMRGRLHHRRDMVAEPDAIALADRHVERRDPRRLGGGTGDGRAGRRLDRRVAAGVIGMPVRVPDPGDAPAALVGFLQHRIGLGGIDHHRLAETGSWTSQI